MNFLQFLALTQFVENTAKDNADHQIMAQILSTSKRKSFMSFLMMEMGAGKFGSSADMNAALPVARFSIKLIMTDFILVQHSIWTIDL